MSDRIAVMSNGRIEQVGTPGEVYEEPGTAWVADFLGISNLMDAHADGSGADGSCAVHVGEFRLRAERGDLGETGAVKVVIRPERVSLEPHGASGENRVPGMIERLVYTGPTVQLIVRLAPGALLSVMLPNRGDAAPYRQGTPVSVFLPPDALRVLRADRAKEAPSEQAGTRTAEATA